MCYNQEKCSRANTSQDDFVMISVQGTWRQSYNMVQKTLSFLSQGDERWISLFPKIFRFQQHQMSKTNFVVNSCETLKSTFLYIVVFLGTFKVIFSSSLRKTFLLLTNRVRGPYCKFRTELFPHRFMYGPIAQRAGHKSNGKTSLGFGNNFYSRRTALNFWLTSKTKQVNIRNKSKFQTFTC